MKKWTLAIFLCLFLGAYALVKSRVDARMTERRALGIDIRYLPTPRVASILSLGYKPAVADIYWIEAINYFGSELGNKNRTIQYLEPYANIILALDPLFTVFYDFIATSFIYSGLPITPERVAQSQRFVDAGIRNLFEKGRYDSNLIVKGAFNYGLELGEHEKSLDYFELVARAFPHQRHMLLVGSSYANYAKEYQRGAQQKLEYLSYITFEADSQDQIFEALSILTSQSFNAHSVEYIQTLRLQLEKDERVQKLISERMRNLGGQRNIPAESQDLSRDERFSNLLKVDISRNWMPPDLHVLVSL